VMGSLSYIPRKSTLLLLFDKALLRLLEILEANGQLTEERLAVLTEERNRIADKIRDAPKASTHDDAALRPSNQDEQTF
jgi:hypothetical protein